MVLRLSCDSFELKRTVEWGASGALDVNSQQEVSCSGLAAAWLLQDAGPTVVTGCTIAKCMLSTRRHGQQGSPSFTGGTKYGDLDSELKKRIHGKGGWSKKKEWTE